METGLAEESRTVESTIVGPGVASTGALYGKPIHPQFIHQGRACTGYNTSLQRSLLRQGFSQPLSPYTGTRGCTMTAETASMLAKLLQEKGVCSSTVELESSGECILYACRGGGRVTLVVVSRHKDWVYAKAVPEEGLPAHMWHCDQVYYTPYGLYVFGKTVEEVAEKLSAKLKLLNAIAKLAAERAAAMTS